MGKVDLHIYFHDDAGNRGGDGGGRSVVPGGGGDARPEGTSPRGGGNKAARGSVPELMYGPASIFKREEKEARAEERETFRQQRSEYMRAAESDRNAAAFENKRRRAADIAQRQAQKAADVAAFNEQVGQRAGMSAESVAFIRKNAKVNAAARSVQAEFQRGEAQQAAARLSSEQEKMTPLAAAMDRMTGFFQQLIGGTSSAAQRSAVQSGSLSGLAKGFIFGGIGRNLASSAMAGLDPGANSAQVGADTAKGLAGAGLQIGGMAISAAMKMGGLPGFMVGTAISGIANQAIDAVAGPDIRKSQTAADMISNEIMASHRAGIQMTPERLERVGRVSRGAAEMTEDAKQIGAKQAVVDALRSGNAGFSDRMSAIWHDPLGSLIAGLEMPFTGRESADRWVADRIQRDVIDRLRPATRDAAFESPSSH